MVYAGFFVRLCAYAVDMLVVGLGLLIIRIPVGILSMSAPDNFITRDLVFEYSISDMVLWVLTVVYFVAMTYNTGSTLGKKLFRLEVISTDGSDLNLFEVVYRESIGRYLSTVILWVGYLIIGVDSEKRGFHDMLADTRVVYADGTRKSNARKRWEAKNAVPTDAMGRPLLVDPATGQFRQSIPRDVSLQQQGEYQYMQEKRQENTSQGTYGQAQEFSQPDVPQDENGQIQEFSQPDVLQDENRQIQETRPVDGEMNKQEQMEE